MNAEQFTYWLQGFFEVAKPVALNSHQTDEIRKHLALAFKKVTPATSVLSPHQTQNDFLRCGAGGSSHDFGAATAYC